MSETVFDRLKTRSLQMQRVDEFGPSGPMIDVRVMPTGDARPGLGRNEQWEMSARLSVVFWANRAQVQVAAEIAHQQLASVLYQDVLAGLARIAGTVSDGDRGAALRAIEELRASLIR